jgi:hypothetical protein
MGPRSSPTRGVSPLAPGRSSVIGATFLIFKKERKSNVIGYWHQLETSLFLTCMDMHVHSVNSVNSVMKNFGLGEMLTEFVAKILKSDQFR